MIPRLFVYGRRTVSVWENRIPPDGRFRFRRQKSMIAAVICNLRVFISSMDLSKKFLTPRNPCIVASLLNIVIIPSFAQTFHVCPLPFLSKSLSAVSANHFIQSGGSFERKTIYKQSPSMAGRPSDTSHFSTQSDT